MDQTLAREVVDMLRQMMATRDAERILSTFDDFLAMDANAIRAVAERELAAIDLEDFERDLYPGEELRERLTMAIFYASMLHYLCEKCPRCENAVEHDIENWIEANAPALAHFNAETLRLAMPGGGYLEDIDPRLAPARLEDRQLAMMETTWAAIEARIADRLAARNDAHR